MNPAKGQEETDHAGLRKYTGWRLKQLLIALQFWVVQFQNEMQIQTL